MRILLVAEAMNVRDDQRDQDIYDDLWDMFEDRAEPELKALNYLRLVLEGPDEFTNSPPRRPPPSEVEVDDRLINDGVSWDESLGALAH